MEKRKKCTNLGEDETNLVPNHSALVLRLLGVGGGRGGRDEFLDHVIFDINDGRNEVSGRVVVPRGWGSKDLLQQLVHISCNHQRI